MKTRTLGSTGIVVSEVGLGTWGLGGAYGPVPDELARSTIEAALESGVTTFDAAPLWGAGRVEEALGATLHERRDEVVLITRGGVRWRDGAVEQRYDEASLRADCEGSLARLRSDRVDVWLLHDPPETTLYDPVAVATARALVAEGKARAWGVSTADAHVARVALAEGAQVLCMPYNVLVHRAVDDLGVELAHVPGGPTEPEPESTGQDAAGADPSAADPDADPRHALAERLAAGEVTSATGVGFIARSPLMHGLLSGRWTEYRQFADDDHRRARWTQRALTTRVRHVNALRFLVEGEVRSMTSAALRFVLANPRVGCAMLGARRPVQILPAPELAGEAPYLPTEVRAKVLETVAREMT